MTLFKIDENLPPRMAASLRDAGRDAVTVADQAPSGTKDEVLPPTCKAEGRILVSLNLDFADIRPIRPAAHLGSSSCTSMAGSLGL